MQQITTIHSSSCKQVAEMRILTLRTPQMHYSGPSFEVLSCPHSPGFTGAHNLHQGHQVELVRCGFWCYHQVWKVVWGSKTDVALPLIVIAIAYSGNDAYMGSGKMIRAHILYLCQFCTNLNFLLLIVSSYLMEHFDKRNKRLWENWMSCFRCTKLVVTR